VGRPGTVRFRYLRSRLREEPLTTKDTNPKDAIGSTKLDMGLFPDTAVAYGALAMTEGALKYGRYNYRIAGVRASIYAAALRRHMTKWWNGENVDPKTQVPHLASALGCLAVLVDALECDKLTDDRPPHTGRSIGDMVDAMQKNVAHLNETFADHHPHQYTITDSEG
jgi:hypothetical protein